MVKPDFYFEMKYIIKEAAIHYYNLGFNITHINPQRVYTEKRIFENTLKEPSHRIKNLEFKRQERKDLLSFDWEKATGVGAVMGYKQVRSIDIDGCEDDNFIQTFLDFLGLPSNYEWVVKTGSGKGFQILILSYDHPYEVPQGKIASFIPKRQYKSKFNHLELRWTGHVVLPPSKHNSGNYYQFTSGKMPVYPPFRVNKRLIAKTIEKFCKTQGDSESKGSFLDNFLSDEYAFKYKIQSFETYLHRFYKEPFYFFIDIKTNEIPNLDSPLPKDLIDYPEIIQIATMVCDSMGKRVSECDFLIVPDGWKVKKKVKEYLNLTEIKKSSKSIKLQGREEFTYNSATNEFEPDPPKTYFHYRYNLMYNHLYGLFGVFDSNYKVGYIIGHNIQYQINCLSALYSRYENDGRHNEFKTLLSFMLNGSFKSSTTICTMQNTATLYGIYAKFGYKNLDLRELCFELFNEDIGSVRDAKIDVYNVAKCYWKLRDIGKIQKEDSTCTLKFNHKSIVLFYHLLYKSSFLRILGIYLNLCSKLYIYHTHTSNKLAVRQDDA